MKNLHVVFTMNPSTDGLKDRAATSPALFNRCVLNWFGDWSDNALYQVSQTGADVRGVAGPSFNNLGVQGMPSNPEPTWDLLEFWEPSFRPPPVGHK